MNIETRQALSLLHKSVEATTAHAENVDMRSMKAADRDVVRQARIQLYALARELDRVLNPPAPAPPVGGSDTDYERYVQENGR